MHKFSFQLLPKANANSKITNKETILLLDKEVFFSWVENDRQLDWGHEKSKYAKELIADGTLKGDIRGDAVFDWDEKLQEGNLEIVLVRDKSHIQIKFNFLTQEMMNKIKSAYNLFPNMVLLDFVSQVEHGSVYRTFTIEDLENDLEKYKEKPKRKKKKELKKKKTLWENIFGK